MEEIKSIIEMTPFIFEDGQTYYFNVTTFYGGSSFHKLYVYEKYFVEHKSFFGKVKKVEHMKPLNPKGNLISIKLDTNEIKRTITDIITGTKAVTVLKDWDGFVGKVPDDTKKAILRNARLSDLLGE